MFEKIDASGFETFFRLLFSHRGQFLLWSFLLLFPHTGANFLPLSCLPFSLPPPGAHTAVVKDLKSMGELPGFKSSHLGPLPVLFVKDLKSMGALFVKDLKSMGELRV